MKTRTCIASSVIAIVASMASMTSAHAQEAGARPAEGTDDDIIVTARRVDERLQDVPVAVTAIRDPRATVGVDVRRGRVASGVHRIAVHVRPGVHRDLRNPAQAFVH